MSGDKYRRVQAGGQLQISAAAWNACLELVAAYRRGELLTRGQGPQQFRQADIVLVQNVSGNDVARFGVLGIDGVIVTPANSLDSFQGQVALRGTTPAAATHTGTFVVLLEPLANNATGRAWLAGVCQVQVDIASTHHTHADVNEGDRTKLRSTPAGTARILYREPGGVGNRWCVVRLADADCRLRIGKITQQWAKNTLATVTIYEAGTPPNETATGETIANVVNHWGPVAAGKWVGIQAAPNGQHYLVVAEC